MPTRPLPNTPSFEHLRNEARRLQKRARAGDAGAIAQLREFHPRAHRALARLSLADAQLATARSYGFESWSKLKRHVAAKEPIIWNPPPAPDPRAPEEVFLHLACLTYLGWHRSNPETARRMLDAHPGMASTSIYTAAAAGDADAVRRALDANPALVNAKGGPLRWEPLLYACYSRLDGLIPGRSTVDAVHLLLSRGADPDAGFLVHGRYAFTALTGAFGRGEDWDNEPPHPAADAVARALLDAGADANDSQALYNRHFKADNHHLKLLFQYGLGADRGGRWLRYLGGENANPSTMLAQQLCWAAQHGFRERVELLLDRGVDIDARSARSGRTAYEEAVRAGRHAVAEYLLQRGAKKTELDALETFALACIDGRREEVRERLSEDPTLLDRLGHERRVDMLHRALDARQREGIRLLVELGVDINGMVPGTGLDRAVLHNAAGWAGLDMVKFLLDLGADPALRDSTFHATPIGWALHNQQRDVVEFLLPSASIFDAVRAGGVERVAALLREDASLVHARDTGGNALAFYLHPEMPRLREIIDLLKDRGADFNARDRDGKTPLDRALAHARVEFAEVLRAAGGIESPDSATR